MHICVKQGSAYVTFKLCPVLTPTFAVHTNENQNRQSLSPTVNTPTHNTQQSIPICCSGTVGTSNWLQCHITQKSSEVNFDLLL